MSEPIFTMWPEFRTYKLGLDDRHEVSRTLDSITGVDLEIIAHILVAMEREIKNLRAGGNKQ